MSEIIYFYFYDYTFKMLIALIILSILNNGKTIKKKNILLTILLLLFGCFYLSLPRYMISDLVILAIAIMLNKKFSSYKHISNIIIGNLIYMYIYSIENLLYIICLLIIEKHAVTAELYYIFDKITFIISMVVLLLLIYIMNKHELFIINIKIKMFSLFTTIEIIMIAILLFIINSIYKNIFSINHSLVYHQLLISGLFISITLITIGLLLCEMLIYSKQMQKDLAFQRNYISLEKDYLATLKKRDEETKKFRHDIKKHLSILSLLLEEKNYTQAEKYLQ